MCSQVVRKNWVVSLATFLTVGSVTTRAMAGDAQGVVPNDKTPSTARMSVEGGDQPRLDFHEPEYDFGRIIAGDIVRRDFRFTNRGDLPLTITEVHTSCGCSTAVPYDKNIPPGGTGVISTKVDTKKLTGETRKTVTVRSNDPVHPTLYLQLVGKVVQPIEATPHSAQFYVRRPDVPQTRTVRIVNNLDTPVKISSVESSSSRFAAELKTLEQGKAFELTITASPPFAAGHVRGEILLKTDLSERPVFTIPATCHRPPSVWVSPARILLPSPLEKPYRRRVLVFHASREPMKITNLEVTGGELKANLIDARPSGGVYRIMVSAPARYELPATGEQLIFQTDDASTPAVTVPIEGIHSRTKPDSR